MSRGGSYGGGQSSLGYLFGSDEKPNAAPPPRTVNPPPYGIDTVTDQKPPDGRSPTEKEKVSNNYHRAQGQNSGNFITVSTITCFHVYQVYLYDGNALSAPYLTYIQFFHMLHIYVTTHQDRPSTKVKSVPGGDSSLGYLFGDK
jgi:SPIRAL1-like protein